MTISKELLEELLSGVDRPEDLLGDKGLMKELKVRLMERMLGAELTEHLGYEPHGDPASPQINRRNGATRKVLKGNDGAVSIDIPRDRDGSFEPELIRKGQTRIDGMDDKIIGLYAAGLSTRDIRAHLEEVYGLKVSADLISRVTDAVLEEVSDWQNRALDPMYPIHCPAVVCLQTMRGFFLTLSGSKSAMRKAVRLKTKPFTWPWALRQKANARFRGCGSPTTRGPSSGSR
jgi:transposase-like protein